MNDKTDTVPKGVPQGVHDDLAFMRDLAERGQRGSITGGSLFLAGGLLYGVQCLYYWAELGGLFDGPAVVDMAFAIVPTVLFVAALVVVLWKDRNAGQGGLMSRALNAVFGGIGLANLAMVVVFGFGAASGGMAVWLFYPAVIFALQGAAWYTAAVLRKRAWLGLVAAGWLASAVALGLSREALEIYLAVCTASLFLLMALPGYVLIRLARKEA